MKAILAPCALVLAVAAMSGAAAHPDGSSRIAEPQDAVQTCEAEPDAAVMTPVLQALPPAQPKPRGLTCSYTCTSGGTNWTLVCNEDTEEECCEIADAVCPDLEQGSTGTVSCEC